MQVLQITASWFTHISAIDRRAFFAINNGTANPFFDNVMPVLREANAWVPLYLFMLVFALANFGKRGGVWILFVALTAIICDQVSSTLIKQHIFRLRPCQDQALRPYIRILATYCPKSSSFTSSHAVNHFGMAVFFVQTLKKYTGSYIYLFYLWATIICFAQVYVGVHYPFDVLSGAVLGAGLGWLVSVFFNNYAGLISLQDKMA